jgi:ABC-type dipeptide/oligopeptide/nickel transport system permease component
VVLGVSVVVFGLLYLAGDPVALLLPADDISQEEVDAFRRAMGFDRPVHERYLRYLGRALRGDLGFSFRHQQPAGALVLERVPATLELAFAALFVSLLIGVPMGIAAAMNRGSTQDAFFTAAAVVGNSVPIFWLGIVLILTVSVWLQWLPASGRGGIERLILPALTLGAYSGSITARLLRSSLIEVLGRDYVRTARAKGLGEGAVIRRHSLKNAALPVVTVVGLQMGQLLSGAIITETVFAYPGMGLLAIQAIRNRDVPVVQAFVIMAAIIVLTVNLIVDLLYVYLDPRVRYAD